MEKKYRLYYPNPLNYQSILVVTNQHNHYLSNVLRLKVGDRVYLFNEKNGEWQTKIISISKREIKLQCQKQSRTPLKLTTNSASMPTLCFAPIKRQRMELLIEKSVELGVDKLQNIYTAYSNAPLLKTERCQKLMQEAAEQCDRITIPEYLPPLQFAEFCRTISQENPVLFFREHGKAQAATLWFLASHADSQIRLQYQNARLLIGPEGGFSPEEMKELQQNPNLVALSLGNRILRSETAAMVALSLWQSFFGDFNEQRI